MVRMCIEVPLVSAGISAFESFYLFDGFQKLS